MSFAHLHCHSEFSLLDGANRLDDLIARAKAFEQPALAITDHGNLFGAWEFQEKAKRAGLKPIIGMEAYVAPGDRRERSRATPSAKPYYHLVLLARDNIGYRNLVKLSSLGYTEGFYTRPRIDRELLERYSEGLIVTSACMAGEIAQHLLSGSEAGAEAVANWYAERFPGRYYLEVQAHASEGQARLNDRVFALAERTNLPVVATNDSHFLTPDAHDAHDILLCIGLGKDRSDPDRMRYDRGLYFKSAPEIAQFFPTRPDVLENTVRIADECHIELSRQFCVPSFPLPPDVASENELLVRRAKEGVRERYGDPLPPAVRDRLDYELGVITKTGYAGYLLIVADFINAARERGIPVGPGRGSSAGSLVCYSLKITDIDPLTYDLLFERFLNPERVSMPDIDVDFCFERRGEVIEYVREKYGKSAVGQIVTFGTMKSRAAIKDVGRVLGFTPAETDALAKLIPNQPNYSLTVKEAVAQIGDVKRLYQGDERYRQLLDYAIALEGLSRHTGVHAAGVVIAPGPLDEYVPICTQSTKGAGSGGSGGSNEEEIVVVTQYDMTALEKAGMLKIDFLGLTTLTVIHDTLAAIAARGHEVPDLTRIAYDDDPTYHMLRTGRTVAVFQFESPLATDLLRGMRADRFDDLVASNALMRPGPLDAGMHKVYMRRKRGEEPVVYALPELKPILDTTFGVITYQEQVMRVAQVLAGISLGEADVLRKAVGKKDAELIKQELTKFIEKSVARGYDRRVIEEIAAQLETFGRYGFPKAHSVAYSVISYHTAYLKCHHPAEFMAAMLSSSIGNTDNVVKYINEGRELGLDILPPDVNESGYKFTVVGDKRVRFGLGAIRNVGRAAIDSILSARAEKPFTSLFDLCERVDLRLCNKRVFEALIHSGAIDALGGHRAQYAAALDTALHEASLKQDERISGQGSLFGELTRGSEGDDVQSVLALPNVQPYSEPERLSREKEILGFYTSGHPLEPFSAECALFATHTVSELGTWSEGQMKLGVVITGIKRQVSKSSGAEFARLTVEDFSGSSEVLIFADRWSVMADRVRTDVPVLLSGGYSRRDRGQENATFIVESIQRFEELRLDGHVKVAIELGGVRSSAGAGGGGGSGHGVGSSDATPTATVHQTLMRDIRQVIDAHPGSASIEVRWTDAGNGDRDALPVRFRSRSLSIAASPAALHDLRALLGHDQVKLERSNGGAVPTNGGAR
jgi:DNA polymerase-3 subunit alpha